MEHYLAKWPLQRYANFKILYLAFHGEPEKLFVGDRGNTVDLDWLEERLDASCRGCLIHFGSCGTMDTHGKRLQRFMKRTGALALCGYQTDVDWMLSSAFELMLMSTLQKNAFTRAGLEAAKRRITREAAGLVRELDFRFIISNK